MIYIRCYKPDRWRDYSEIFIYPAISFTKYNSKVSVLAIYWLTYELDINFTKPYLKGIYICFGRFRYDWEKKKKVSQND